MASYAQEVLGSTLEGPAQVGRFGVRRLGVLASFAQGGASGESGLVVLASHNQTRLSPCLTRRAPPLPYRQLEAIAVEEGKGLQLHPSPIHSKLSLTLAALLP